MVRLVMIYSHVRLPPHLASPPTQAPSMIQFFQHPSHSHTFARYPDHTGIIICFFRELLWCMPAFIIIVHVIRHCIQTTPTQSGFLNPYSQMGKRCRSRSHSKSKSRSQDQSEPSISPAPFRRNQILMDDLMADVDGRFEIISWNVNGACRFLKSDTRKITSFFNPSSSPTASTKDNGLDVHNPLRKFLERHAWPQVVCLQEVKINPQDSSTIKALEIAANYSEKQDSGPAYTAHFSLPRDKYNATGFGRKVHGVCTLIHRSLLPSSVTREVDWDLEGRVLITEFPKWKLAVINGYWVNGTTNPYRSPETGEVVGTRHDWKRKFHALMLAEAKSYEGKGYHVVLIGDMNIAPSLIDGYPNLRLGHEHVRNRQDFNDKFLIADWEVDGMRGIDTFRHFHGGLKKYTYHGEPAEEWGDKCDRVDLGIVSRSLVESIRGALTGAYIWDTVEERGGSDHVPLSIVLDIGKLEEVEKTVE